MKNKITFAAAAAMILISPILATAATISIELSPGMTGSEVSALQSFLATDSNIYPEGIVSGYYGELTTAAVKRYQIASGISPVGRVGPVTLASINGTGGTGGTNDINSSITNTVTVTPATNSAMISWSSNEPVFGRVMYATSWPFLYSTAPIAATPSGFNALQALTLNNLQSQTTYYFVLESTDVAGNLNYTIGNSFRTK